MIRKISMTLLLAIFVMMANCVKIDEIENVKQKSQIVTKDLIRAIEHLDSARAAELFSRSAETVLIDPVNDSLIIGSEQIKSDLSNLLSQIDGLKIHLRQAHVFPGADLASSRIAGICDVKIWKAGQSREFQALISGYLEKIGSVWRYVQLQVACKEKSALQKEKAAEQVPAPQTPPAKKSVPADSVSQADSLKKATGDTSGTSY
jgi:hypothetical protein